HFTFSNAHFFLAASHSLRVIAFVWSQVEVVVEVSALLLVVAGAVATEGLAGRGVCCATAVPEHNAKASADSASALFIRDMMISRGPISPKAFNRHRNNGHSVDMFQSFLATTLGSERAAGKGGPCSTPSTP